MKLNGSPRLRLYNEKSDVIRPYYSLTHRSRSTSSTMYCVSTWPLRHTTIAKIRLRTDCCNAFLNFLSMGAKVPGNESSVERKFLGHSLLSSGVGTSWKVGRLNSERLPSPPLPSPPSSLPFPSPRLSLPLPLLSPSPPLPSLPLRSRSP